MLLSISFEAPTEDLQFLLEQFSCSKEDTPFMHSFVIFQQTRFSDLIFSFQMLDIFLFLFYTFRCDESAISKYRTAIGK